MKAASMEYIINTVFRTNILPIISECNTSCIFCSHKQNPQGIEVFRLPKLGVDDFKEIINFISPNRKLVIGESATRIIEGEPLLHENFMDIIALIRKKYPHTPMQITTNGILLDENMVSKMVELQGIELNVSVNCVHPDKRRQVLGLRESHDIADVLGLLKGRLKFSGSCVVLPGILEWSDIEDVIRVLEQNAADSVRLFLPGYTAKAGKMTDFFQVYDETKKFVDAMRQRYTVPIIIEPSYICDTQCVVEGTIKETPAYEAGIKAGDIITEVNGVQVSTRVDGFNRSFRLANPVLGLSSEGVYKKVKISKARNTSPGFTVLYDADPDIIGQVSAVVQHHDADRVLFITSELAFYTLSGLFGKSSFSFDYDIAYARNDFFGGTIKCAGLLTVDDIVKSIEEYLENKTKPDLVMVPSIMFDYKKRDLLGVNIKSIEERTGITADTV